MTREFWQLLLAAEAPPARSRALIEGLGSFAGDPLEAIRSSPLLTDIERKRLGYASMDALTRGVAQGVRVLEEADFPPMLAMAPNIPPALFVHGDIECLSKPTVAIVGTRSASTYGKACAQKFAEALARAGATIVSGGALGIDAAAHKGAIAVGGKTVAVLAGGVDNVYPAVHAGLFRQIRENGCIISQFAMGSKPSEYKFLVRNALAAALSQAVLVVEAPYRSGAIRTAHAAAELGRDVYVVPASIDQVNFGGSFNLIRDGATLVAHPDQLLEELDLEPSLPLQVATASASGSAILRVLSVNPLATELIVERTGLDAADVLSELTMLELEGRVLRDQGGYALKP